MIPSRNNHSTDSNGVIFSKPPRRSDYQYLFVVFCSLLVNSQTQAKVKATGVAITPKYFPKHSGKDLRQAFRHASKVITKKTSKKTEYQIILRRNKFQTKLYIYEITCS